MLATECRGLGGVVSVLGEEKGWLQLPSHASLLTAVSRPFPVRKEDPYCAELDIGGKKCSRPEAKP